tara:strand:- start:591 stop:761 length:171 start_codon:yes stop_codon:yes gene_type:complete
MSKVKTQSQPQNVDLSNIDFNRDGVVRFAINRKKTQRKLWESMQQFADIPESNKSK